MKMTWKITLWMYLFAFIGSRFNITFSRARDLKTWRLSTNFDNPRLWEDGILPCANDRVIFSASTAMAVYMPESFSVGEMVLPLNGQLIFPKNATVAFTGGKQENACKGKDVTVQRPVDFWYNPASWNLTSDRAFPRKSNRRNAAVPHAFQVPCIWDEVQFPSGMSFQVHHDFPFTTVAILQIHGVNYTNQQFRYMLTTPVGRLLFPNKPMIYISPINCRDPSGCFCENDSPQILPTICTFEVGDKTFECADPIQPLGHCNPMCGAKIIIRFEDGFNLGRIMELYESILTKSDFSEVESFTSKTHDDLIQSVFVDVSEIKGLAVKAAKIIYGILNKDMEKNGSYKLKSVQLDTSENWLPGIVTYDSLTAKGISSGGIAATVIAIVALFGIAAAFYIYKKRQIPGFSFARFDLRADKIELELGTTPHEDLQPGDIPASAHSAAKDNAFDNPVYGTSISSEAPEDVQDIIEGKSFIENPMFTIFEDSSSKQAE